MGVITKLNFCTLCNVYINLLVIYKEAQSNWKTFSAMDSNYLNVVLKSVMRFLNSLLRYIRSPLQTEKVPCSYLKVLIVFYNMCLKYIFFCLAYFRNQSLYCILSQFEFFVNLQKFISSRLVAAFLILRTVSLEVYNEYCIPTISSSR